MKILALLLSIFCAASVTLESTGDDGHQFIPIRVLDNTTETGRTHRSQIYVPVQAYYDGFTSSLCLIFLQNIGEVEILITNINTGDCVECDIDSDVGTIVLPITGNCGIHQINILLCSGRGYEGEFRIE